MLPRERRIPKSYFTNLLKDGVKLNSPHLLLTVSNGITKEKSRFSFSVSKKVAKNAVLRNKLRRRGYSVVKKYLNKIVSNKLFFFSYKKGSEKIDFSITEKEIIALLNNFIV